MHFIRTIAYLLLVAALTAGVPACGFAWCLEGDGSLRVEATGPEGGCVDAAGTAAAAPPTTRTAFRRVLPPGPCVVLAGAQWEMASNPDGEGSGASVAAPGCSTAVWCVAFSWPQAETARNDFRGDEDRTSSDTVLIRETVALLI